MLALVMVLRVGCGKRPRVHAKCRARTGCTAKARAKGKVVPVRELNAALRGILLQFVPSPLGTCPRFLIRKKCDPRLLRRQHTGKTRAKGQGPRAKGQGPRAKGQGPRAKGQGNEAKRQRKERMKNGTLRFIWKNAATISILSVPQIMYLDLFLCGTMRHNQDEPQWIVAQRLLFGTCNT